MKGKNILFLALCCSLAFTGIFMGCEKKAPVTESNQPVTILVAAAASLEYSFREELIPRFQKKYTWITVEGAYDSSGRLQIQIEQGLNADVFMPAATRQMEALVEKKLVDAVSVHPLLENKLGIFTARFIADIRRKELKVILDEILTLPLVFPPTVVGFFLLYIFGIRGPIGRFFLDIFGYRISFSWTAAVLAAAVISFPLMYHSARGALEQLDTTLVEDARTLGLSEWGIFWKVRLPIAMPGIAAGGVLAFARGLGEFGATAMIAGNIAGKTRTMPLAIYSAVAAGDMDAAMNYVIVIIFISFIAVALLNWFSKKVYYP
jgi:molybdate transport system permease protein